MVKNNSNKDTNVAETKKANATSEKLTDDVVKQLVGHTNVVYYNCETNVWNTNKYNDYAISRQESDIKRVKEFKSVMEKIPEFSNKYEFAASITMTIGKRSYPGWAMGISNPRYSENGTAVVGNIIVRNKATGKYELYCKSWIGVGVYDYFYPRNTVNCGVYSFVGYGARISVFRVALIAEHAR